MSLLRPDENEKVERMPPPGRTHPLRHRLAVGFTVVLAVAVALVGAGVAYAAVQAGRLDSININKGAKGDAVISKVPKGQPVNILVVGNDSRAFAKDAQEKKQFGSKDVGESLRSDTMMVMRLDPKNDRVTILSIARDLYVDLEGGGQGRITRRSPRRAMPPRPTRGGSSAPSRRTSASASTTTSRSTSPASARPSTPSAGSACTSRSRPATPSASSTSERPGA